MPSSTTSTFEELVNGDIKSEFPTLAITNDSTGSDKNTNYSIYVGPSSSVYDSRDSNASFNAAAHGNRNQDETYDQQQQTAANYYVYISLIQYWHTKMGSNCLWSIRLREKSSGLRGATNMIYHYRKYHLKDERSKCETMVMVGECHSTHYAHGYTWNMKCLVLVL